MSIEKSDIVQLDNNHFLLEGHQTIVAIAEETAVSSSSPTPKKEGSNLIAFWGAENDFPQQVISETESDTEQPAILDWKGRVLQGKRVIAVQEVWDENLKDFTTQRIDDEEINTFLLGRIWKRYWREACIDFTWFQNVWPDLIKSTDKQKIAYIGTHEAAWCRWGIMDKNGNIAKCYVSAQWQDGAKADDREKVTEHVVVNPYSASVVEELKASSNKKFDRFVYPINYPSPGKAYYPSAAWTSFLFSDWFKIKKNIPIWKFKLMTRVLSSRKIIVIPLNYWRAAYKDWDKKPEHERLELKKAKVKEINDKLTGLEGVGSAILSEVGYDEQGKEIPSFKIESIDSGFADAEYLEDSQEASGHLNRANNVDATLNGTGPGRGKDAGSGSDKRVAFNIYTATLQPYRDVLLEPLEFIAEYNGWTETYPTLQFKVLEVDLQTLDQGSTSKETNPITPLTPEPKK
jgi:hypothetical protein